MIKMNAERNKMASQMRIDRQQQDLWQLTSASQPNLPEIDQKVVEISKLKMEQQMSFIHSVSDATNVLTPQQREAIMKLKGM